jgi:hypothetical protein
VLLEGDIPATADTSSRPFRWLFYGARVVLTANANPKVEISLPRLAPILDGEAGSTLDLPWPPSPEDTEKTCTDDIDNDRDTQPDCASASCQAFCQETPSSGDAGTRITDGGRDADTAASNDE